MSACNGVINNEVPSCLNARDLWVLANNPNAVTNVCNGVLPATPEIVNCTDPNPSS